jgi:hypothetical protein
MFENKNMTTTAITFFNGFVAKKGNGNYNSFFGGFAPKKVTTTMLSPISMLVVL